MYGDAFNVTSLPHEEEQKELSAEEVLKAQGFSDEEIKKVIIESE